MFTRKTSLAAALVLGAAVTAAFAAAQDPEVIARKEAMGLIGSDVKKLTAMAKGDTAFDTAMAQQYFAEISEQAGRVPTLFETKSNTDPESDAKDAIWDNWDDFVAKANGLKMAADAGASVDSPEALGAALGALGGACKACHSVYKD